MKLKASFFLCLFMAHLTFANTAEDSYKWLHAKGFTGMNSTSMVVDANNNTYFYGFSYDDLSYDNHTTSVDYYPDYNAIFVIKVNAQNEYEWTKKIDIQPDQSSSFNVRTMDVDDDGNMYFGGDFRDSVVVNSKTYVAAGSGGYFLMKTNPNGDVQWFKSGTTSYGSSLSIKYTAGRIAFVYGWSYFDAPELFGFDLQSKFGSVTNFVDCDMVVGALSPSDGDLIFLQGLKTNHYFNIDQLFGIGTASATRHNLDADSHGNLYVSGGFKTNTLKVAGTEYTTSADMNSESSQFVLRIEPFGSVSWVKLLTNATGFYPTISVNEGSGLGVLFPGRANKIYIDDQQVDVNGDAEKFNHIALLSLSNGELLHKYMINSNTLHISASENGSFCVAGNLNEMGQYFGMDGLYNPDTINENLFVGFLDKDLMPIAGQAVISTGKYRPFSMSTGADGNIRLLGAINYTSDNQTDEFPFGEYKVTYSQGSSTSIFSVLSPKLLVKGQLDSYPTDCEIYSVFASSNMDSRYEWYVNDTLKGTGTELNNMEWGGYKFSTGTNYVRLVLTDSTDANNSVILLDTVSVYDPTITINLDIDSETGLVKYDVDLQNYAEKFQISIDRGNYNYDTTFSTSGSYVYTPGEHTISVIINTEDNWNCFARASKTFTVPEPGTASLASSGNSHINVYPQIVDNTLKVKNCPLGSKIRIYNNLCRLVTSKTSKSKNLSIEASSWNNGIYFIKIEGPRSNNSTYRILKK